MPQYLPAPSLCHFSLSHENLYNTLQGKEEEICLLRSRLSQQEEASRKLAERLKADTQLQLEQAVQNERYMWEKEQRHVEGATLKQCKYVFHEDTTHLSMDYFYNCD